MFEKVMINNIYYVDVVIEFLKNIGFNEFNLEEKEFLKLLLRIVSSEIMYLLSSGVFEEIISFGKLDIF